MVFPEEIYTLKDGRTILLRPPLTGDAEVCIAFLKDVGGETDFLLCDKDGIPGLTLEGEENYLAASRVDPHIAMYLGLVEGKLAAVFDVRPLSRPRIAHVGLVSLSVRKAYWGNGIGALAMETMVAYAKGTDALRSLTLEVREGNDRAIALYERFGFRPVGRHKGRIRVGDAYYDEILMDLELTEWT